MKKDRLRLLQEMLKEDPDNSFLFFALAKEQEKIGQIDQAIEIFLELKEKDEKYVGLYYHLAKLYEQTEEKELALSTYQAGIEIAKSVKDQHALGELQNAKMNLEIG